MNVSCRYHEWIDRFDDPYLMNSIDEVQDSINLWTKKLLLDPNEMLWWLHSPNIVCTHICVSHEETVYVNGILDYTYVIRDNQKSASLR